MKMSQTSAYVLLLAIALSCMTKNEKDSQTEPIDSELAVIDSLLRNEAFALEMAKTLDAAYYAGVGQPPAPFLSPQDDTAQVKTSRKDEKIAISVAGFYALECGLGAICASTNQKPTDLLQTIVEQKTDSATVLLFNRFANATWKAGQPFRGLDRIKRPNFIVASLLSKEEVKKDYDQIQAASGKLLLAMQEVRDSTTAGQMRKLKSLLQREQFASDMAASQEAAYYTAQHKPVPPFLTPDEAKATVMKSVKEQKIATSIAGFYALECGLNYLVTTQQKRPSAILKTIADGTISKDDKELLCRFANATWKAGQPFRGLNRITRATFTPFYFLTEADIEKDWVQVKAAAGAVLANL